MSYAPFLASERDGATRMGRAKSASTTYYSIPGVSVSSVTTFPATINTDYYSPWYTPAPVIVDQIAVEVTAQTGGNFRVGVYAADGDWQPVGPPVVDSGSIALTTAVKTYTPASPLYLPRGRYLSVLNTDTAATFRQYTGATAGAGVQLRTTLGAAVIALYAVARSYAAFPTPGTPWDTITTGSNGTSNFIVYRQVDV